MGKGKEKPEFTISSFLTLIVNFMTFLEKEIS